MISIAYGFVAFLNRFFTISLGFVAYLFICHGRFFNLQQVLKGICTFLDPRSA